MNKLKSAAKYKTEKRLRLNKNAFAYNMLTDIKVSKVKISKIIQSGGSFNS